MVKFDNTAPVIVKRRNVTADVNIAKEHDIKINSRNFILTSSCSLDLAKETLIPEWLNAAITLEIAKGNVDLLTVLGDLDSFVKSFTLGINQQITTLQTDLESTNTLLTTSYSTLNSNIATNFHWGNFFYWIFTY